ncbi:hypothetical protein ACFLWS_04800 [Chloroflexota bacterium]
MPKIKYYGKSSPTANKEEKRVYHTMTFKGESSKEPGVKGEIFGWVPPIHISNILMYGLHHF